jgi:RNase adaptor protein for sRNA GlmZ degradation
MHCGPDAALRRQGGTVLRCPRCGAGQQIPALPLFVVTGASGTGKTTITAPLRRQLPDCDVFEIDVIWHAAAALGLDSWRNTWLQLAHAVALNGRATVLCGSLMPSQLETLPARKLTGPIHFCTLDCPDAVLDARLRSRPAWRGTSTETAIAEHQRFTTWLRMNIQPCYDTSLLTPGQTADRIATWIRHHLAQDATSPASD